MENKMGVYHEIWRHGNGERYGIKLEEKWDGDPQIVGVCGPLRYDDNNDPDDLVYGTVDVEWAKSQIWQ